jgi:GNAT superfamily N-acetyltransferase
MDLNFQIVTRDNWCDFESFFESKGCPHYCWCMAWRKNEYKETIPGKKGKKQAIKRRVDEDIPIGILAIKNSASIAWCSVAPRETYLSLGGDDTKMGVWSLTCFFVKRNFRNMGVATKLLDAAINYARKSGARYLEAYPVDPNSESPSYRFMGYIPMFVSSGFKHVKMAGKRRHVMLLELS